MADCTLLYLGLAEVGTSAPKFVGLFRNLWTVFIPIFVHLVVNLIDSRRAADDKRTII